MTVGDPVVFSRPLPIRAKLAIVLVMGTGVLGLMVLAGGRELLVDWLTGAGLPFDPFWVVMGTITLIEVLLGGGFLFGVVAARRHYGHCELLGDQAVFRIPLAFGRQMISLNDVDGRSSVPGGTLLHVKERGRWVSTLFPLLVPTSSDEELAEAVGLLDRTELQETLEGDVEERGFGRKYPLSLQGLDAVASLVPFLVAGPFLGGLFFQSWLGLSLLLTAAFLTMMIGIALALAIRWPRYRLVKVGRQAILLGNRRVAYAEIRRLAKAPPFLACEGATKKDLIWFGDRLDEGALLLNARFEDAGLPLRVEDSTPAWADRGRRRTRVGVAVALTLFLWLGLGSPYVFPPEVYGSVVARDDLGNSLRLVYRIVDEVPVFLLLVSERPGAGRANYQENTIRTAGLLGQSFGDGDLLVLDLAEGVGQTPGRSFAIPAGTTCMSFDSVGRLSSSEARLPAGLASTLLEGSVAGRVWDRSCLPASLGKADPLPENGVLADFVRGESSNRIDQAADAQGWRLVWGVSEGEPAFAFAAPVSQGVRVSLGTFQFDSGPSAGAMTSLTSERVAVLHGLGGVVAVPPERRDLPSVESLRGLTERIRAGESVKAVTSSFLADLWPSSE